MKKLIAGTITAFILIIVVTFFIQKDAVNKITFEALPYVDGTYIGDHETPLVTAKVKVVVENNEIKSIELLEHNNGLGQDAENILTNIINEQTYQVDTVSGATMSSQVIKKAVETAIRKGN